MQGVSMRTIHRRRAGVYKAMVRFARISGNTLVIRRANAEMEKGAEQAVDWFLKEISDRGFLQERFKPGRVLSLDRQFTVSLSLPTLVSAMAEDAYYIGQNHQNYKFATYNFGLVRGRVKALTIADFFRSGVDGRKLMGNAVYRRLRETPGAAWVRDRSDFPIRPGDPILTERFILTPTAFTFLFAPYEVGPFVAGSFTAKIPFIEFQQTLDHEGPLKPLLSSR